MCRPSQTPTVIWSPPDFNGAPLKPLKNRFKRVKTVYSDSQGIYPGRKTIVNRYRRKFSPFKGGKQCLDVFFPSIQSPLEGHRFKKKKRIEHRPIFIDSCPRQISISSQVSPQGPRFQPHQKKNRLKNEFFNAYKIVVPLQSRRGPLNPQVGKPSRFLSSGISISKNGLKKPKILPLMLHLRIYLAGHLRVKLNRVFFPRWSLYQARSPGCGFAKSQAGTVGFSLVHSCASLIR
eukprot:TRINITY_DN1719_c0_g1_i4.p2 TRINITY_DN1719_c0_g1~~TRINITY_DN1719_c0_g1_i4.p2  ORF type:complete len:234 (+),score=-82.31 TRINITY_DN1719_c0_g1_i4:406-1107(+)